MNTILLDTKVTNRNSAQQYSPGLIERTMPGLAPSGRLLMTIVIWTCCVVIALSLTSRAEASEDSVYTSFFSNDAAGGYDVTAYFDKGAPEKGDSRFMTAYNGADWLFSSQENLDKFVANPEKYAPQYGGYCAWAVAKGELYKGDPLHWSVVDGKLYLNYDQSVQDRWLKDVPGFISSADSRWPTVLN